MAARLSWRDLESLQDAIRELYELRELDGLRRMIPQVVLKAIPADFFTLIEGAVDPRSWKRFTTSGVHGGPLMSEEIVARMDRMVPTHPFTRHMMEHGPGSAMMFSDFLTQTQFVRTEMYN